MKLSTLTNRVRKLEPLRKGRVYLVDGLNGQKARDVLPRDLDPETDIVVFIGDEGDDVGRAHQK